jgi:hypothetical protein
MPKINFFTLAKGPASVYRFRENKMSHRASRTSETVRQEARRGTPLDRDQTAQSKQPEHLPASIVNVADIFKPETYARFQHCLWITNSKQTKRWHILLAYTATAYALHTTIHHWLKQVSIYTCMISTSTSWRHPVLSSTKAHKVGLTQIEPI